MAKSSMVLMACLTLLGLSVAAQAAGFPGGGAQMDDPPSCSTCTTTSPPPKQ